MVQLNRYVLRFSGNGNTGGQVPITQSVETEDNTYTFTIPNDNNLLKTGYGFIGWSESPAQATTAAYGPGSTVSLTKDSSQMTLYAVWYPGLLTLTNMQEMTTDICKYGTKVGETKQLIDTRDGKEYWTAKLKDENCWMTQNLDLDIPASGLKASDTDLESDWTAYNETTNPNGAIATLTEALSAQNWPNTNNIVRSWDPALGGNATYCNDGTSESAGNCKSSDNPTTSVNEGHDAQGNYYSWGAATAGESSSLSSTTAGQESSRSICPKGWRLPIGYKKNDSSTNITNTTDGSFAKLTTAYSIGNNTAGIQKLKSTPLYFVSGGYVNSGGLNSTDGYGHNGFYWSSTAKDGARTYNLVFGSSDVDPSNYSGRYLGVFVRCVAR